MNTPKTTPLHPATPPTRPTSTQPETQSWVTVTPAAPPNTPVPRYQDVPGRMSPIPPLPPTYDQLANSSRRPVGGRGPMHAPGQAQMSDEVMLDRARGRR